MLNERNFDKKIVQSNAEEKEELWKKIELRNTSEREEEDKSEVLIKSRIHPKYLIFIPCFLLFSLAVILIICRFTIWKNSDNNGGNGIRYCTYSDYYISETDVTIKRYSLDTGKSLLYFEWYETTEYYFDQQYKLNDTDEIICLEENLVDDNGLYIYLYLTDNRTDIDFIKRDTENCTNTLSINSIDIKWGITSGTAYVGFSYDNHNYYLKIEGVEDKEYIENLVSTLLS